MFVHLNLIGDGIHNFVDGMIIARAMVFAQLATYSKKVNESRMSTPRTKAISCNADFRGLGSCL